MINTLKLMKMKKIIFPALLFATVIASAKENTRISGRITNPLSDSIKVQYSLVSIAYIPREIGAKLDKDGNFSASLDLPEGYTQLTLRHGDEETEIFCEPGADLAVTLDGKRFDSTLHYEGRGKEIANFMARAVLEKCTMQYLSMSGQMLCVKDPDDFEKALAELKSKEMDFLQKSGNNLPERFKNYFKTECQYNAYCTMQKYPHVHEMYKQKSNSVKDIPKEDFRVVDDIPEAFNDDYLDILSYRSYLGNFFATKITSEHAGINTPEARATFMDSLLARTYRGMPHKSAEFTSGQRIYNSMSHTPVEKTEQQYADYKMHFQDSKNLAILSDALFQKKNMGPGKKAPDFDIYTPDGKKMKLSDLRGNVVYLDFWSRSCVPCIGEMPDAKKVREHFRDKPVKFVYISLDPNDDVWRKAIKDYEVDGINMRVDKEWESDIVKNYGVKGMPSYFLIDKEGKFAAVESVARPSESERLIAEIEPLIK